MGPHRGDDREKKSYTGLEFPTLERPQNAGGDEPPRPRAWDRWRRAVIRLLEQILFEPQSPAQREQLARKILDYSRMNRKDSEPPLIHVPEMADRFRESRRNVRQSLTLLEENGTVERTQSKDHWKLTIQVHSPARATYDPPQVSAHFPKMPANPPPGWIELQNRAHRAKNAQEFNQIIDEMNRLLSAHEEATGNGSQAEEPSANDRKSASNSGQQ